MGLILTILAFLAAITALVFIHEYGHFKVARLCGVKVKRFSIGFGKPFWRRVDRHGTEWAIAPFPLGGYVSMVDSRVEPLAPGEEHVAFDTKPLWKRAAIVAAGPLINLLFAWAAWTVLLSGASEELAPRLGSAVAGSLADQAGFAPEDKVVSVDGSPTASLSDAHLALVSAALAGRDAQVQVERVGQTKTLTLELSKIDAGAMASEEGLRAAGFASAMGAALPARLLAVLPGGVAERAGMKPGDSVTAIDGQPVATWSAMAALVGPASGRELSFALRSLDGTERVVKATPQPDKGSQVGKLGISFDNNKLTDQERAAAFVKVRRSLPDAMGDAAVRCWKMTKATGSAIWSMISGRTGSEGVSGPIGIAQQAGEAADHGAVTYLNFLAFLSLSLFMMNMLPLPALDGGHLAMFAVEAARGKPLSEQAQIRAGQVGFSLLACLMLLGLFNDLGRLFQ
jgi:regulator of sigma E protease